MNIYAALGVQEVADRLLLVDGHSAVFRSFYAIPDLTTAAGEPVNAVYGFARTLLMALRAYPSRYVAVAFDAEGKTVRHEEFAPYKANRKEMPPSLAQQLPRVRQLVEALGILALEVPRYEADDVMATLSGLAVERGKPVLHLTGDKDMAQLVSDRVFLLRPGRRPGEGLELLDRAGVQEKWGVAPEQIVDFLALVGDASDNVPGVRGVGEKTARRLLAEHGTLEAAVEAAGRLANRRLRTALAGARDQLEEARQLLRLRRAPVGVGLEDCVPRPLDPPAVAELLRLLEFRTLLAELKLEPAADADCHLVLTEAEFSQLVRRLETVEEFALDLETTGRDPLTADIVGVALAVVPGQGYYVPVAHAYPGAPSQLPLDQVLAGLRPLLAAPRPRIIGQNLKYDLEVLARHGVEVQGVGFDAMLAHWLLRPDAPSHSLEAVARDELGLRVRSYRELLAAAGEASMAEVPLDRAGAYAAQDAEVVCRLRPALTERLRQARLLDLFDEVEVPLVEVLSWMERRGVLVDPQVLREQGKEVEILLERVREEMFALAGEPFNPSSVPQVRRVLFDRLGLPVVARTRTGPSTNTHVLRELAARHELPAKLIAYRELEKLRNTYIDKLPEYVHPRTGRVHTSFNQTGTATGRLSSSEPNLQNIPARHAVGVDIRRAFVAPRGRLLLAADYSQVELRILAHLSGDRRLADVFHRGEDLHRRTAAELFGVDPAQVDARQRAVAKRVNFGIVYGISPYGLARDLGISQQEAKLYIDRFFAAYPQVRDYLNRAVAEAEAAGCATTLLGRRRPLPGLASRDNRRRAYDRRNAVNTPIQGSAADLMKLAMLRLHRAWEAGRLPADMILQIHDELIFEVDHVAAAEVGEEVRRVMEGVWQLRVPLRVDLKTGENWGQL
ncbi:MAG: DNA polymerase I [Candidatus Bipolaricaulaceae bacterium]